MSRNKSAPEQGSGAGRVQSVKWNRPPEIGSWLAHSITAQEVRYQKIVREMDELSPERDRWIAEFMDIIQNRGFTVTGDTRRVIKPEELPSKPDRKHVVVF